MTMFKSIRALARDKTAGRGPIAAAAIASLAGCVTAPQRRQPLARSGEPGDGHRGGQLRRIDGRCGPSRRTDHPNPGGRLAVGVPGPDRADGPGPFCDTEITKV
jgi:hypothetical protein